MKVLLLASLLASTQALAGGRRVTPEETPPGMVYVGGGTLRTGGEARCARAREHFDRLCEAIDYERCPDWDQGECPEAKEIQVRGVFMDRFEHPNRWEALPTVNVTQDEAQSLCEQEGKRLPTAHEWELALRGEAGRFFPWGDVWDSKKTNWGDVTPGEIAKRNKGGRYRFRKYGEIDGHEGLARSGVVEGDRTEAGIHDMAGNVREWTFTTFPDPLDDKATLAVIKGGCYEELPWQLSGAYETSIEPHFATETIGFRCVMDVIDKAPGELVIKP